MSANVTEVDTTNDFMISAGENLPNHTSSMRGRGKFIRQGTPVVPEFRDKQSAFRYAAWLVTMADAWLPDDYESEGHDFETIWEAVRNT